MTVLSTSFSSTFLIDCNTQTQLPQSSRHIFYNPRSEYVMNRKHQATSIRFSVRAKLCLIIVNEHEQSGSDIASCAQFSYRLVLSPFSFSFSIQYGNQVRHRRAGGFKHHRLHSYFFTALVNIIPHIPTFRGVKWRIILAQADLPYTYQ